MVRELLERVRSGDASTAVGRATTVLRLTTTLLTFLIVHDTEARSIVAKSRERRVL